MSCCDCKKERRAGNAGQPAPQPVHYIGCRNVAGPVASGLSAINMLPTLLLPPPVRRRPQMRIPEDCRILQNHLRQRRCFTRIASKLMSCAAIVRAAQPSRVLLREEALWARSCTGTRSAAAVPTATPSDQPLVAQHPAQRGVVFAVHPVKGALAHAINASMPFLLLRPVTSETVRKASAWWSAIPPSKRQPPLKA
jgi:hypothetical protein